MRLYARAAYDAQSVFTHDFFSGSTLFEGLAGNDVFNRLFLRGRSAGGPFVNDVVVHRLMQPVFHGVLRSQPVAKFINGEFWGLTAVRDRFDHHHLNFNFGLELDNMIITDRGSFDYGEPSDAVLVNQFFNFLRNADFTDPDTFSELEETLCLRSYIDHLVVGIYFGEGNFEYGFWARPRGERRRTSRRTLADLHQ